MIIRILLAILILIACFGVLFVAHRYAKYKKQGHDTQKNRVTHSLGMAMLTIYGGIFFALFGALFLIFTENETISLWLGFLIAVMGLLCSGFMVPSLSPTHDILWDEESLEGPSKLSGPSLGQNHTIIKWDDVTTTGQTSTGYFYVGSRDGSKIYYSPYSKGLGSFKEKLKKHVVSE